jgi:hypothetical protein
MIPAGRKAISIFGLINMRMLVNSGYLLERCAGVYIIYNVKCAYARAIKKNPQKNKQSQVHFHITPSVASVGTQNIASHPASPSPLQTHKPLTQPCKSLIQTHKPLTQPCKSLIQPHKPLTQPCKSLMQPCKPLTQPCKSLIQTHKPLTQPCKSLAHGCGVAGINRWKNKLF